MEKYISPQDFINQTVGRKYDVDGVAGVQCVDAIKKFTQIVYGKYDFNCGKCGYAYGLWTNFATMVFQNILRSFHLVKLKKVIG